MQEVVSSHRYLLGVYDVSNHREGFKRNDYLCLIVAHARVGNATYFFQYERLHKSWRGHSCLRRRDSSRRSSRVPALCIVEFSCVQSDKHRDESRCLPRNSYHLQASVETILDAARTSARHKFTKLLHNGGDFRA